MARVFEAMQKSGVFGSGGEKTEEFLQFYNFNNQDEAGIRESQPEILPHEQVYQSRSVGLSDVDTGRVLDIDLEYNAATAALYQQNNQAGIDENPLRVAWDEPYRPKPVPPPPPAPLYVRKVEPKEVSMSGVTEIQARTIQSVNNSGQAVAAVRVAVPEYAEPKPDGSDEPPVVSEPDHISTEEITFTPTAEEPIAQAAAPCESETQPPVTGALVPVTHSTAVETAVAQAKDPAEMLLPDHVREEFRLLRSSLLLAAETQQLQVLMVCGIESGDGASFVSRNLSLLLAEFDKINVARFELSHETRAKTGQEASRDSFQLKLRKTSLPNLRDISSAQGMVTLNELLHTCDTRAMIAMLKERFDFVLIDTPAVTDCPDTALLASQVDGVILVAQQDETKCNSLSIARTAMQNARARILGVILNKRKK